MIDLDKAEGELVALSATNVEVYPEVVFWSSCDGRKTGFINTLGSISKDKGIQKESCGELLTFHSEGVLLSEDEIVELGINDITNLKDHEYGLLRLKYGLTPLDMYLPEELRGGTIND